MEICVGPVAAVSLTLTGNHPFSSEKKRKMERTSNIKASLLCVLPSRVSSFLYHTVAAIISNTASVNCKLLAFLPIAIIY